MFCGKKEKIAVTTQGIKAFTIYFTLIYLGIVRYSIQLMKKILPALNTLKKLFFKQIVKIVT